MSAEIYGRGNWMQTQSGRRFYPMDARPEDVDPGDIAHALAMLCRYNGHVDRFYSVAEHCVLMSYAVPTEHALWALLHDAAEAYVGDMVRPLKQHMPTYRAAEDRVLIAIAQRFHLTRHATDAPGMPREVKMVDARILLDERNALMANTQHAWDVDDLQPLGVTIEGWQPERAKGEYLLRLRDLTGGAA
jgi:hypothetical protein